MVTAREAFEAKKLAARYGVVGKVAGRYRTAGFQVRVDSAEADADYNFVAWRRGEKYAVKVYNKSGRVPEDVVEKLARAAAEKAGGARPVLVLYGAGPKVTEGLLEKARSLGVSIRRVRV